MQLLDTHQHLIYPDRFDYSWAQGIAPLQGSFTLPDYTVLAAQAGIGGTLFMETAPDDAFYQAETRFVLGLIQAGGSLIQGVVAGCRPETDAGFEAWLEETDVAQVAGYRRVLHVMDDDLSRTPTFRRNVARLGARGKTFDLCVTQSQLPIAGDLVRACPDTMFVLDHCGNPDIADGAFPIWASAIDELAALPNIACKISGVVTRVKTPPAQAAVTPYIMHCLDRFGADRVVWGGDWPVVLLATDLPDWVEIMRSLAEPLCANEREKLFVTNARRIYRIPTAARLRTY